MKKQKKDQKKPRGAFHKNLKKTILNCITNRRLLDSNGSISLYDDTKNSSFYVIHDSENNSIHYISSLEEAQVQFKSITD